MAVVILMPVVVVVVVKVLAWAAVDIINMVLGVEVIVIDVLADVNANAFAVALTDLEFPASTLLEDFRSC